jgi:hypothetical protein
MGTILYLIHFPKYSTLLTKTISREKRAFDSQFPDLPHKKVYKAHSFKVIFLLLPKANPVHNPLNTQIFNFSLFFNL